MPRVSVIIPVFNRAHLVAEAIDSVLNQEFADFELIVVDDGSTDGTGTVVGSYRDQRLVYIRQRNEGASAARNAGIAAAAGEFVAFLDSDDLFLPKTLAIQMAQLDEDPSIDFLCGDYCSSTSPVVSNQPVKEAKRFLVTMCYLLTGAKIHLSTVAVRRSCLERTGGFNLSYPVSEEWDLYLRLGLSGCRMEHIGANLAIVRQQPASLGKQLYRYEEIDQKVMDCAFSDPRMPADLHELRTHLTTKRLLLYASSAYVDGQPALGRQFLERAILLDRGSTRENMDKLAARMVSNLTGLSGGRPEDTLQLVMSHLPGPAPVTMELQRHLRAQFYTLQSFRAYYAGRRVHCIGNALRAIAASPSHVNRGIISILMQSTVGTKLFAQAKRAQHMLLGKE